MDWADEIARGFCSAGLMDAGQVMAMDKSPEQYADATKRRQDYELNERSKLAAALRKAKADGMREAAEFLADHSYFLFAGQLRDKANKLDPPTD